MNLLLAIVAGLLLALSACQSSFKEAVPKLVPIRVTFSDTHCKRSEPAIELLRDSESLKAWWEPLSRQALPAREIPKTLANVDFGREFVLIMYMGQQPTTGYRIELINETAILHESSLLITTNWWQPRKNTNTTQIVTNPCLAVTVPVYLYEAISVEDERGRVRLKKSYLKKNHQ